MSQTKPVTWFEGDPKLNTFFFRSPFRSWKFIVNTILVAGLIIACAAVIWNHWNKINHPFPFTIISFFLLTVGYPYWWAIKRHGKIRRLYRSGEISDVPADSPLDQILQVADNSMNEGLRNACALFGLYLLEIVWWQIPHIK